MNDDGRILRLMLYRKHIIYIYKAILCSVRRMNVLGVCTDHSKSKNKKIKRNRLHTIVVILTYNSYLLAQNVCNNVFCRCTEKCRQKNKV